MPNQQGQAFEDLRNTISECSRIVRHRWRFAVIGLSLVGSIAFWCSQFLAREYSATTMFERRDDVVLQNLLSKRGSPYSFHSLKSTMRFDMVGSRAMGEAFVRVGLLEPDALPGSGALSDAERAAVDKVAGRYEIEPTMKLVQSSAALDTILLQCNANDPQVARDVVAALRDNYVDDTRERIKHILQSSKEWYESELAAQREQLQHSESELRRGLEEFEDVDPTDLAGVANRLELLRAQRDEWYDKLMTLEAEVTAREAFLREPPPEYVFHTPPVAEGKDEAAPTLTGPPTTVPAIENAIREVQGTIVDALTHRQMTEEHPFVRKQYKRLKELQRLRGQMQDMIEAELAARQQEEAALVQDEQPAPQTAQVTEAYREYMARKKRVEMELEAARKQLASKQEGYNKANDRLMRFERLYDRLVKRDDAIQKLLANRNKLSQALGVYEGELVELNRLMAAESGERGTQFTLLEEPQASGSPIRPRVGSIVVVCSGLGLAAAALLVALAELFDRSFRSVGRVTRTLGLPVLECIAVIQTPRERRRAMMSRLIWGPMLGLLMLVLGICAMLAYSSLAMPHYYNKAIKPIDTVLRGAGLTQLSPVERDLD